MKRYFTRLVKPVGIIPQVQGPFWIFILITIMIGQAGILFSLLSTLGDSEVAFHDLLSSNLIAGNFYTFSISLIASSICPFLVEYLGTKDIRFRHIKVITSLFAIVTLLLPMTCLYVRMANSDPVSVKINTLDWKQLSFYGISIAACIYLFCVSQLHYDYDSYADLDLEGMARLRRDSETKTQDSKGNSL